MCGQNRRPIITTTLFAVLIRVLECLLQLQLLLFHPHPDLLAPRHIESLHLVAKSDSQSFPLTLEEWKNRPSVPMIFKGKIVFWVLNECGRESSHSSAVWHKRKPRCRDAGHDPGCGRAVGQEEGPRIQPITETYSNRCILLFDIAYPPD